MDWHARRNLRLPRWNYSIPAAYFITICVRDRQKLLGTIVDGVTNPSEIGVVVADAWESIPTQYQHVTLDEWCLMPDHLHGIVVLGNPATVVGNVATADAGPTTPVKPLGRIVGAFKTVSTKRVNILRGTPGALFWQRSFWDRIVRDDAEMNHIRQYIRANPSM